MNKLTRRQHGFPSRNESLFLDAQNGRVHKVYFVEYTGNQKKATIYLPGRSSERRTVDTARLFRMKGQKRVPIPPSNPVIPIRKTLQHRDLDRLQLFLKNEPSRLRTKYPLRSGIDPEAPAQYEPVYFDRFVDQQTVSVYPPGMDYIEAPLDRLYYRKGQATIPVRNDPSIMVRLGSVPMHDPQYIQRKDIEIREVFEQARKNILVPFSEINILCLDDFEDETRQHLRVLKRFVETGGSVARYYSPNPSQLIVQKIRNDGGTSQRVKLYGFLQQKNNLPRFDIIYLDYCGSWRGFSRTLQGDAASFVQDTGLPQQHYRPPAAGQPYSINNTSRPYQDIAKIFAMDLVADRAVLALTLYAKRGLLDQAMKDEVVGFIRDRAATHGFDATVVSDYVSTGGLWKIILVLKKTGSRSCTIS